MSSQVTITQLPNALPLTGTEAVPIVQNGVTVQTTTSLISGAGALNYPFLTVGGVSGLTQARYLATGSGLSLTDNGIGNSLQINLIGAAQSLDTSSSGIQVKDGSNVLNGVKIATSGNGLSITNADGITGNPTLALTGIVANLASTSGSGILVANSGSISPTSINGTSGQINVTNGSGVSGNPTVGLVTSGVSAGSYTNTNLTVDSYGRITTATSGSSISGVTSVASGTGVSVTGSGTGPFTGAVTVNIANTTVTPGSYTNANITVNAQGQITSASSGSAGGVTTFQTNLSGLTPSTASTGAITLAGTLGIASGGTSSTTASGALTALGAQPLFTAQTANTVYAGPTSGSSATPSFRALVSSDIPSLPYGTVTSITAGTGLSGGTITTSGTIALANTTVTAGTYGSGTAIPSITVNAQGQITSATTNPLNSPAYQGTWNASTNSPTLASGIGTNNNYYVVSTAGTTTLNGISLWSVGDWAIFNGSTSAWEKINGSSSEAFNSITVTGLTGYMYANGASAVTTQQPVTSVGLALPSSVFSVSGSPVTTTGTLTGNLVTQGVNTLFAGPASGSAGTPTFRALTSSDLPALTGSAVTSLSFGTTGLTPSTATQGAITVAGTLAATNGGTGLTSLGTGVATALGNNTNSASGIAVFDANKNLSGNSFTPGWTSTTTAAGTTTFTVASTYYQRFVGSTTQTVKLPDATTVAKGQGFIIDNDSLGSLSLQDGSSASLGSVVAGMAAFIFCEDNSTTAGSWSGYMFVPGGGPFGQVTWGTAGLSMAGQGIDNAVIGATTPAAGTFTTLTAQNEVLKGTGQNFLLYSQSFTTSAYWSLGSGVSVSGGVTDPLGGTNAFLLTGATGTTYASSNLNTTVTKITSSTTYTFSLYVQAVTATTGVIQLRDNSTGGITTTTFTPTSVWQRVNVTATSGSSTIQFQVQIGGTNGTLNVAFGQVEFGSVANTYIPTTTTAVYGTPSLSFSGVAGLGLQSDGSLYVSPAGTGALQAQKTDSTATGGNARGANAVDWQTSRSSATRVASSIGAVIAGGAENTSNASYGFVGGGYGNSVTGSQSGVLGGENNTASGLSSVVVGGHLNNATGRLNFIGGGETNTGTSSTAVTTQTTTIAVTAGTTFYLTATNANIKVGQMVVGTGVPSSTSGSNYTYATSTVTTGTPAVMNTSTISGTTLTVGSLASGTIIAGMVLTGTGVTAGTYIVSGSGSSWVVSASQTVASTTITGTAYTFTISQNATTAAGVTLSFYTPHGVVVGGGNNQATGAYSFIGGGGDAGVATSRNVASGDWSTVAGGWACKATGEASFVGGGGSYGGGAGGNTASGLGSGILAGYANLASNSHASVLAGGNNTASGLYSATIGGYNNTTRGISGITVFGSRSSMGSTNGQAQCAIFTLSRQTTDATASVLTCDNSTTASGTNQVILPNNSAYSFRATIIAGVTGAGNTASWILQGAIKRGSGVGTAAIVGTVNSILLAQDSGASTWAVSATADTTNGGLAITVTGQASTTIRWVCKVETTELTY